MMQYALEASLGNTLIEDHGSPFSKFNNVAKNVAKPDNIYTQVNSKCRFQLALETSLGKALIEENGCSLI